MNIIKRYKEYLKDNPNNLWFKRKLYGWGWTPATWQGWLVVGLYLLLVILLALAIDENAPAKEAMFMFFLPMAILTATLIRICYKRGEKPRWQWGRRKE